MAEQLLDELLAVLLHQTELEGVLEPLAGEGGVDAGHELLGQVAVVAEDGAEVERRADVVLLAVAGEVEEGALADEARDGEGAGVAEGELEVLGDALLARVGRVGEGAEKGVDEADDLLAALNGQLLGELVEEGALGLGLHDLGDGRHAQLGQLLLVLVQGHEDLLDLAGHDRAQLAEGVDRLGADDGLVGRVQAGVLDDLLELEDGQVESGVGERLQAEDLLVLALRLAEHLGQLLKRVRFAFARLFGSVSQAVGDIFFGKRETNRCGELD